MTLVVDASVAMKWVIDGDGWGAARRLIGNRVLAAPDLISAELANALWRQVAAGFMTADQAIHAVIAIDKTLDERYPLAPLSERAVSLACRLGHPAYDCFYLALAETLRTRVITADRRLAAKVAGTEFAGLVEMLA